YRIHRRADFSLRLALANLPGSEAKASRRLKPAPRGYSNSVAAKKNGISTAAVSGASDPCTQLRSMPVANFFRIVPSAALAGLVAPLVSRPFFFPAGAPRG